ncbi:MAG: hypothetical protein II840_08305 [Kiritimatiellae bacterium]|nr:hypothetical protein [Kiritimatiellia bacterium]
MAGVRVEEAYSERDETIDAKGNVTEIEIPYLVFGVGDESAALAAARPKVKTVSGMTLESIEVVERINGDTWKVKAVYEEDEDGDSDDDDDDDEDTTVFAFDTGGGTKHINQSLKTDGKYPNDAPDFAGAIEVDNEGNVNGVDVTMPVLNFTETHTLSGSRVSTSYKKTLASLTGTVNRSGFRGFSAGEVLFLGASGTKRSKKTSAPWEITYRFAVSPNRAGFKVGDIQVTRKYGWDYLWVRYADKVAEGGKNVVKKPVGVYVEMVYPEGDFGNLGIGN